LKDHGDLVSLIRANEGRLLAIAPDAATAAAVDPQLLRLPGLTVGFVAAPAAEPAPAGWQAIAAVPGSTCNLVQALGLEPGRILVVRPDLHSAGCIAPAALGALIDVYRAVAPAATEAVADQSPGAVDRSPPTSHSAIAGESR